MTLKKLQLERAPCSAVTVRGPGAAPGSRGLAPRGPSAPGAGLRGRQPHRPGGADVLRAGRASGRGGAGEGGAGAPVPAAPGGQRCAAASAPGSLRSRRSRLRPTVPAPAPGSVMFQPGAGPTLCNPPVASVGWRSACPTKLPAQPIPERPLLSRSRSLTGKIQ